MKDWEYEVCKKCMKPNKIGFHIDDDVWNKIVPKKFKNKVLCYYCFEEYSFNKKIAFKINNLFPIIRIEQKNL